MNVVECGVGTVLVGEWGGVEDVVAPAAHAGHDASSSSSCPSSVECSC